jgi:hypothetical protein
MYGDSVPIEMQILQDRDVIITEVFHDEAFALEWARSYRGRLEAQGWFASPAVKAS